MACDRQCHVISSSAMGWRMVSTMMHEELIGAHERVAHQLKGAGERQG